MNLVVYGKSMDQIVMQCLGSISGRSDFRVSVRLSCVDVSLGLSGFWCFGEGRVVGTSQRNWWFRVLNIFASQGY